MKDRQKNMGKILKWIIVTGIILLFLFLLSRYLITGNVINETTNVTCKSAWQSCPLGNECCEGLSCLGGTCKTTIVTPPINQTSSNQTTATQNQTCKSAWQTCSSNECCEGLTCQGGTCKVEIKKPTENETLPVSIICNSLEQSCDITKDCCGGLTCSEGVCVKREIICVDSDGGKNSYLKGRTLGFDENEIYFSSLADKCISIGELGESYCNENLVKLETISCVNGCEEGVCKCKSSEQSCESSLECCLGFNCVNKTCASQSEQIPTTFKNKFLCTFIGQPCDSNEDCCSKNCVADWDFLFWESDAKKCGRPIIK